MNASAQQVQLIIFDMAGTTVYDEDFVHKALADALQAAGINTSRDEINEVMGYPKPVAIRTILESNSEPSDSVEERTTTIHADFLTRMNRFYQEHPAVREITGASETFKKLKEAGVKVGLDTGFSRTTANIIIERLGWTQANLIDVSVTSDEVERGRPYPDMIQRAMALTGIESVDTVAKVGDTPSDLQEGQQAGCALNIGVTYGSHTEAELKVHPHTHLISDIQDIPDPLRLLTLLSIMNRLLIVGSGIVGLAHAMAAIDKGWQVTVFERHSRPLGATTRNFGTIWPIGQPLGPLRNRALRTAKRWRELSQLAGFPVNTAAPCTLSIMMMHGECLWNFLPLKTIPHLPLVAFSGRHFPYGPPYLPT